jgi:hypothetical protein
MASPASQTPTTEFHCAQCNGELHPDEGQVFLVCPFCGSAVYLDKSKVVFHWSLNATLKPDEALASLHRWMAGNYTVKDLDRKAQIVSNHFEYFPLWYVKAVDAGKERVFVEPAAATSISEIKSLDVPAGDLQKYDPALDSQAVVPTVPFPAMLKWLVVRGVESNEVKEAALVHLPVYVYKYEFGGKTYTALVEGGTGKVFANLYPPKAERPYRAVAALAIAGFLCVSTFPVIGYFTAARPGMWIGLAACAGAGLLVAIPVFVLAAFISAKV